MKRYDFGHAIGTQAETGQWVRWVDYHAMAVESDQMRALLRALVKGIDEWNESVSKVIERPVDYAWPALEAARAKLRDA